MEIEYVVVYITTPDENTARTIAKELVEKKLAACVNIVKGINSIYFWQGNIEDDDECLLIIKTRINLFESLENFVKSLHPYTVPEIIAIPIVAGSKDYLNWIDETVYR
ncbi:divalent-cation tolerance protein CutA [Persephonella sp.]